jgi:hypothetical protein
MKLVLPNYPSSTLCFPFCSCSARDLLGTISGVFGWEYHPVAVTTLLLARLSITLWFNKTRDDTSKSLSICECFYITDPSTVGEPCRL